MGKLSINMNIVFINTILNLSNYQYVSINIAFNIFMGIYQYDFENNVF